jgi:hypothetical protein
MGKLHSRPYAYKGIEELVYIFFNFEIRRVFQKELCKFESLYKFIQKTCTVFLYCHSIS